MRCVGLPAAWSCAGALVRRAGGPPSQHPQELPLHLPSLGSRLCWRDTDSATSLPSESSTWQLAASRLRFLSRTLTAEALPGQRGPSVGSGGGQLWLCEGAAFPSSRDAEWCSSCQRTVVTLLRNLLRLKAGNKRGGVCFRERWAGPPLLGLFVVVFYFLRKFCCPLKARLY